MSNDTPKRWSAEQDDAARKRREQDAAAKAARDAQEKAAQDARSVGEDQRRDAAARAAAEAKRAADAQAVPVRRDTGPHDKLQTEAEAVNNFVIEVKTPNGSKSASRNTTGQSDSYADGLRYEVYVEIINYLTKESAQYAHGAPNQGPEPLG